MRKVVIPRYTLDGEVLVEGSFNPLSLSLVYHWQMLGSLYTCNYCRTSKVKLIRVIAAEV